MTFRFSAKHVLYGRLRPYLKKVLLPLGEGRCSTEIFPILPSDDLIREYLAYWLLSDVTTAAINATCTGARMPRADMNEVLDFELSLPSVQQQQRIVAILDEAFAGIATARANAEQNLKNARELFESHLQSMFVCSAAGWEAKPVGDIADHSLGKMLDKNKNRGNLQPYLRNLNVRWFEFDLSNMLRMRFTSDEKAKYSIMHGDVVICEGGYPGRAAIWDKEESVFFQKALHRVRFHKPLHNRWFLYYLFLMDSSNQLKNYFTGTGIQHFTGAALAQFIVPVPPDRFIKAAIQKTDTIAAEIRHLESIYQRKLAALDELKQSLLARAFAGEL